MKRADIEPGKTYLGWNGEFRTVVSQGASKDWVVWGVTRNRLPLGGFIKTRCTSLRSFARWAADEVR